MNPQPIVAILMPTYNGEKYLKQQLDSIFSQTYQNFHLFVADDCSKDLTLKILQNYQKSYPTKLFISVNKKNLGLVKNFEKLLVNSEYRYIFLSDQDDIWSHNKIAVQMHEMLQLEDEDKSKAYLVHSDLRMIDSNAKEMNSSYFRYRSYTLKPKKDLGHILGPSGVMGNTVLINKKLRDIILPFPKTLDVHDYWIGVQCELFGQRVTLKDKLVKYRVHATNVSNSKDKLSKRKSFKLSRNIKLPNLETNRKVFLLELYDKVTDIDDLKIIEVYIDYLKFKKNRLVLFSNIIRYSLVKRNIFFRMKLFVKILLTNRYSERSK